MRTRKLSLEQMQRTLKLDAMPGQDNRRALEKAARLLQTAMEQELTPRQRECVQLYFFQQMTMEEVGRQLGIGKATVCRHLQKSKRRLGRVLSYTGIKGGAPFS